MMIQEIKQGMKVRNAGGDVFEIMGTKGDLVIVKMLEHNSGLKPVNFVHEIFTPGEILEIDQTSEIDMLLSGYYEVALEYLEPVGEVEEVEIPMFDQGDLVKDKFGNIFKIITMLASQYFEQDSQEYDEMGYLLKLIDKAPNTRDREVGDGAVFHREGDEYWIYNTKADIRDEDYVVTPETIVATELVLFEKSEDAEETNDAKPAKAELTRRYPSIEDLQKMSEENDLGNLLDQAYEILKEQASLGERNANLQFEKFKRCIPHFEGEGFDVLEHGTLIEVRW